MNIVFRNVYQIFAIMISNTFDIIHHEVELRRDKQKHIKLNKITFGEMKKKQACCSHISCLHSSIVCSSFCILIKTMKDLKMFNPLVVFFGHVFDNITPARY